MSTSTITLQPESAPTVARELRTYLNASRPSRTSTWVHLGLTVVVIVMAVAIGMTYRSMAAGLTAGLVLYLAQIIFLRLTMSEDLRLHDAERARAAAETIIRLAQCDLMIRYGLESATITSSANTVAQHVNMATVEARPRTRSRTIAESPGIHVALRFPNHAVTHTETASYDPQRQCFYIVDWERERYARATRAAVAG